ncbi:MAG: 2,3,4,5-tetrahydropyridine-2,6-dicarboxylate N-succinyltransferase [Gammaproteobacteria bacterium]|nr:2,3,4,5-tetrahydropyridine-2,6-dicarboxylate N-succinyltransferase [Gammaproteobacteria bacterium]
MDKNTVLDIIEKLNAGQLRVAEKINNVWITNQTAKEAILNYFKLFPNDIQPAGFTNFYDKIPLKYKDYSQEQFLQDKVRVIPSAIVRKGAYVAPNSVLMPSYVNIGAYIDTGVMVDTWATVGSCAQIGKNVHLSGGVGIGGVLEPLQATPTIIEDNCFIGARSEIVEGVIIEEGAVISMGVYIGKSTKIYNRLTKEITYGKIPKNAVVVPGSLPAQDGSHSVYCAVIVKFVDEQTRGKVALNELLRD